MEMPARITYGPEEIGFASEGLAVRLRDLIAAITNAGRFEWLPLPTTGANGVDYTANLLIGPGIPVQVVIEGQADVEERFGALADEYLGGGHAYVI